jgi:hypothetical protein
MSQLILSNPKIVSYFEQHKDVEPETAILFFIEILEKFGDNIFEKMSSSINTQILSGINELKQNNHIIQDTLTKMNTEIMSSLIVKMYDFKKDYIEELKNVFSLDSNSKGDKILAILEKNNCHLIDKTTILLNDMIPRTSQNIHSFMNENIQELKRTLADETAKIAKSVEKDTDIKQFGQMFEMKINTMIQSFIQSSEERITQNVIGIRDITTQQGVVQDRFITEMSEYITKSKNVSFKGAQSENKLSTIMNQMFPTGEIINTTGQKASGDFLLKREDKPNIIFENKDYENNVYIEEIRKFIRDIETVNTHGIFLSQRSGIASRTNYQIECHKGNILVFVHNVDYSKEKIQIAVDIIDNLSLKMDEMNFGEDENTISKDVLEEINREYQEFAVQKDSLIGVIKDSNKKMLQQVDDMKFPSIEKYLSTKFASTANITKLSNQYRCELCSNFVANSIKSLSAHKRACSKKTKPIENSVL